MEHRFDDTAGSTAIAGNVFITIGVPAESTQSRRGDGEGERYSNFFLTISTNYRPKDPSDFQRVANALSNCLEEMLDQDNLGYFVKFLFPYSHHEWNEENIIEVTSHTNIEEGHHKNGKRVGSHSLIQITHRSKIHLDTHEIKKYVDFCLRPDVKGSYVHVAMAGDGFKNLLNYIRKDEEVTQEDFIDAFNEAAYNDPMLQPRLTFLSLLLVFDCFCVEVNHGFSFPRSGCFLTG
jgi:hypothetical protein